MLRKIVANEEKSKTSWLTGKSKLNEMKVQEQDQISGLLMAFLERETYNLNKVNYCHESTPSPGLSMNNLVKETYSLSKGLDCHESPRGPNLFFLMTF